MAAELLDGAALSRDVRAGLAIRVTRLKDKGVTPRIEALVAAQDPASLAYVRMKSNWATKLGMESGQTPVDSISTTSEVLAVIDRLNSDPMVHGILVQHPLPNHIDEQACLESLAPDKDVDGISPVSLGRLLAGTQGFRCATPLGIMSILEHYDIPMQGKRAVVVGRSVILGKPAALMLLEKNATVTIAHSKTTGLQDLLAEADIVVAAVGKPEFVRGEWLKPGCVVVDAGYNKVEGRDTDVGDCHLESCSERAAWITPVPGGVGPMTVTSLLANTVAAAEQALGRITEP